MQKGNEGILIICIVLYIKDFMWRWQANSISKIVNMFSVGTFLKQILNVLYYEYEYTLQVPELQ